VPISHPVWRRRRSRTGRWLRDAGHPSPTATTSGMLRGRRRPPSGPVKAAAYVIEASLTDGSSHHVRRPRRYGRPTRSTTGWPRPDRRDTHLSAQCRGVWTERLEERVEAKSIAVAIELRESVVGADVLRRREDVRHRLPRNHPRVCVRQAEELLTEFAKKRCDMTQIIIDRR